MHITFCVSEMLRSLRGFFFNKKKPLVIILGGPTSAGKTSVSNIIAQQLSASLINGDSTKIYKGMSCGTNKFTSPSKIALFDIKDPLDEEDYSCGKFYDMAMEEIKKAHESNKIPIIVGGSGLYLRWMIYGKQTAPVRNKELNLKVIEKLRNMPNWDSVKSYVAQFDDEYVNKIMQNDYRKAARIVEICTKSSKKMKDFDRQQFDQNKCPYEYELPFEYRCFALNTPRLQLYNSIGKRCEQMIQNGLMDEVWNLMKRGLTTDHNAGKAIGYRQTIEFLAKRVFTNTSFVDYMQAFYSISRQLAHRQLSWFRHEPGYLWIDATDKAQASKKIVDLIKCSEETWKSELLQQDQSLKYLSCQELEMLRHTTFKLDTFEIPAKEMTKKERKSRRAAVNFAIQSQLNNLSKINEEMNLIDFKYPQKLLN